MGSPCLGQKGCERGHWQGCRGVHVTTGPMPCMRATVALQPVILQSTQAAARKHAPKAGLPTWHIAACAWAQGCGARFRKSSPQTAGYRAHPESSTPDDERFSVQNYAQCPQDGRAWQHTFWLALMMSGCAAPCTVSTAGAALFIDGIANMAAYHPDGSRLWHPAPSFARLRLHPTSGLRTIFG